MPVTNLTTDSLQTQAGLVIIAGSTGTITFPTSFQAPPVLVLTVEARGGTEPAKVSITSVDANHATFAVDKGGKGDKLHWIASTAT
jgi:hypothetical protein